MNNDESFEAEVRATLEGLAREPAPDRLVSRVAAIPSQVTLAAGPGGRVRPPFRTLISGFAAIAAVLALAVAAVVLRSGEVPGPGSLDPIVPTVGPSVPVTAPGVVVTPVPSILVLVTPSPSGDGAPFHVLGDPIPAGFHPMSVTFVSPEEGWVLGSAPCSSGRCPVIAHTLDGGRKWSTIPAPPTSIGTTGQYKENAKGIAGLRFADARDGWAFGPELWTTHDGGATWKRIDPFPGGAVLALGSARGHVHAVVYDAVGSTDFRIASAPVGGDDWTVSPLQVPVGGGPVPAIQLVLSGDGGWVLENDRTVTAGARLVSGSWRAWTPVCSDVVGPAYIAASSAGDLVAACDVGAWSTPQGGHLFVSRDGGTTAHELGAKLPFDIAGAVATPDTKTIVVAGVVPGATVLEASLDGGAVWARVHSTPDSIFSDLGFTTDTQGVAIATASSGASHLLMTRDGGRTWAAVTF